MPDEEHLHILQQGKEQWYTWKKAHPLTQPDFKGTELNGTDLSGFNLSKSSIDSSDRQHKVPQLEPFLHQIIVSSRSQKSFS